MRYSQRTVHPPEVFVLKSAPFAPAPGLFLSLAREHVGG